MSLARRTVRRLAAVAFVLATAQGIRAEVVEEIVAWVNGEIITKSELDAEEQTLMSEIYRRFSGAELDAQVQKTRAELLGRMIDRKILIQRAARLFDLSKLEENLVSSFKEQNKFKNNEELERALAQDGMTMSELRRRLVEMYAPEEIVRFEVAGRLSVSDKEIEAFYQAHPEISEVPARATIREIVLLAGDDAAKQARRAEVDALHERVTAPGADFGEVAREVSESGSKASGGLLGEVGKQDLLPAIERAAFETPVGQVSPVIEMPHGFHLIKVEARTEARRRTLEETRNQIRVKLEAEKYSQALAEYLKKARAESEIIVSDRYKDRMTRKESS